MTTLTSTTLDPALQSLVDARLDTIDRMLLGRVPRADRMGILREVEAQIEELVAQKDPATLGREDILEVLGQLDPPEGYLPECLPSGETPAPAIKSGGDAPGSGSAKTRLGAPRKKGNVALLGGLMSLLSLIAIFLLTPVVLILGFVVFPYFLFVLPVVALVSFSFATTGLILGIKNFGQGAWPIIAVVTGGLTQLFSLAMPLPLLLFFF